MLESSSDYRYILSIFQGSRLKGSIGIVNIYWQTTMIEKY